MAYKTILLSERKRSRGAFVPMFSEEEVRERKRIRSNLRYHKNKEKILAQMKIIYLEKRKEIRAKQNEYRKTDEGYAVWLQSHKRYIEKNPLKVKARHAVAYAVSTGKLKRLPCIVCKKKAHAHHEDYTKPLDVIWLCRKHHQEHHNVQISR